MNDSPPAPIPAPRPPLRRSLALRFSLDQDKADPAAIDASLRAGAELTGANAWILIFAIFIACIGLNVNSTAVIIGAMLVSPLMGPIMGIGYGVGIYDFALIRRSFLNLGIAVLISLATSTAYFLISPLTEAQSELLARTTPTLWDVLIALFGGLAGIVGATRREKSNVIPGVAIATALMPPLCTAGYGLAKGNLSFFAGAFYLFAVNGIFIAFATVVVISLLRLPNRNFVDQATERRVRRAVFAVVVIAALPSLYLANRLVRNELFAERAREFARREFRLETSHMTDLQISTADRRIELTLLGDPIGPEVRAAIERRLPEAGLAGTKLVIHQARDLVDADSIKQGIMSDLFREGLNTSSLKDEEIGRLRAEIARLAAVRTQSKQIALELQAQYPQLRDVVVGEGIEASASPEASDRTILLASAHAAAAVAAADRERIEAWLRIRARTQDARLALLEIPKPAPPKPAPPKPAAGEKAAGARN
jgi:uncharacterized hydrophobic protein (TIGR00271 family)